MHKSARTDFIFAHRLLYRTLQMCKKAHDHRHLYSTFSELLLLMLMLLTSFFSHSCVSISYENCMRFCCCCCSIVSVYSVLKNVNCELIENYLGHTQIFSGFVCFFFLLFSHSHSDYYFNCKWLFDVYVCVYVFFLLLFQFKNRRNAQANLSSNIALILYLRDSIQSFLK